MLKLFFVHCFRYLSDPVSERDSFSSRTNEDCKVSAGLFNVDALPRRKCTSVNKRGGFGGLGGGGTLTFIWQ